MDLKESQNWRDSLWHRIRMRLYTEEHGKKSVLGSERIKERDHL